MHRDATTITAGRITREGAVRDGGRTEARTDAATTRTSRVVRERATRDNHRAVVQSDPATNPPCRIITGNRTVSDGKVTIVRRDAATAKPPAFKRIIRNGAVCNTDNTDVRIETTARTIKPPPGDGHALEREVG